MNNNRFEQEKDKEQETKEQEELQKQHQSSAGTMASTAETVKTDSKEIHSSSAPNRHG
jgi:hypothetical protein